MSGLEGLAALGIACSIFQTVSFGRETLDLVKDVYRNGSIDKSLMTKSTAIQEVASDIMDVSIPPRLSKHEQKLFDVTKRCTGFARDINEEIAFLLGHDAKGSLRATIKTAVKVNWRKRRLERMEKDLVDSEQMMQSALLAWIFKSTNAASTDIDSLGEDMRHFVLKYEQGCRQASELVSKESLQVRETIVRESAKTDMAIRAHVTQTSAKMEQRLTDCITQTDKARLQEKLLNSLKYPGMNERANQIEDPHRRTFRWLFENQDNLSQSEDGQHANEPKDIDETGGKIEYTTSNNASDDKHDLESGRPKMVWSSFTDWLQSNLNMYWIMGKPGSGKSTLSKFIMSERHTRFLLEQWRRDVIIASHYFWRPGTLTQRNIKGMLCSIAHRLIHSIPDALGYASLNIRGLDEKDAITDWTVPDLQRLCLGLISHFGKPLCLLIDGLDECGPEDDHQELLDILDSFKLQNVKIIASSRNEPVFERHFRHQPQLRIQDLMDFDLRTYATDKLHPGIQKDGSFAWDLAKEAEGVFLWLVLVVQSLNRGFGNGDSVTDLRKRMRILPKRLHDLYKDMWERLNDDADIYRKDAALYLRLVIRYTEDKSPECMHPGLSILDIMLASFQASHDAFLETPIVPTSQLLDQCERFRKNVEIRCAGLLGRPRRSNDLNSAHEGPEDTGRALRDYADKRNGFRLVHRSARDFLIDSIDGQNILRFEGMSSKHLGLCLLSAGLRATQQLHSMPELVVNNGVETYLWDLSQLKLAEGRGDDLVEALFSRCFELYSSSILQLSELGNRMRPSRNAVFFGLASTYPPAAHLDHYSIKLIEKRLVGNETRSAVLLNFPSLDGHYFNSVLLPPTPALWLSSLSEVDVNLKCPLVSLSSRRLNAPDDIGPLDHIKVSPFTRLLGFGHEYLDWKPIEFFSARTQKKLFLQLVCDFVSRGGDLGSTVFLACSKDWGNICSSSRLVNPLNGLVGLEMQGWRCFESWHCENINKHPLADNGVLCVVGFEAAAVIQRMLASLLETDHGHSGGNRHIGKEFRNSDLEAAVSFLAQRIQEHGRRSRPKGPVVSLLQPCGNFADMPYRQVSPEDSVNLIEAIWVSMTTPEEQDCHDNLEAQFRVVIARSPFSCIGFRDYLKDHGNFDEFAAHRMLVDYEEGTQYYKTHPRWDVSSSWY